MDGLDSQEKCLFGVFLYVGVFPGACGELLSTELELLLVVLFDQYSCDPLSRVFTAVASKRFSKLFNCWVWETQFWCLKSMLMVMVGLPPVVRLFEFLLA